MKKKKGGSNGLGRGGVRCEGADDGGGWRYLSEEGGEGMNGLEIIHASLLYLAVSLSILPVF